MEMMGCFGFLKKKQPQFIKYVFNHGLISFHVITAAVNITGSLTLCLCVCYKPSSALVQAQPLDGSRII